MADHLQPTDRRRDLRLALPVTWTTAAAAAAAAVASSVAETRTFDLICGAFSRWGDLSA